MRRISLPLAVSLKRLATDFLVFCMEMNVRKQRLAASLARVIWVMRETRFGVYTAPSKFVWAKTLIRPRGVSLSFKARTLIRSWSPGIVTPTQPETGPPPVRPDVIYPHIARARERHHAQKSS